MDGAGVDGTCMGDLDIGSASMGDADVGGVDMRGVCGAVGGPGVGGTDVDVKNFCGEDNSCIARRVRAREMPVCVVRACVVQA